MTAVSGAIANLIGGVSQQPPEIRPPNAAEALVNSWCDVASGLSTRPNAKFVAKVTAAPVGAETLATHIIQKPSGNFQITIKNGALFVTDLTTGVAKAVTMTGTAAAYIATVDPERSIRFVTVGDTTFVYNRFRTCTVMKSQETALERSGILDGGVRRLNPNLLATVWVRQRVGYEANYAIYQSDVRKALVVADTKKTGEIAQSLLTVATSNGMSGDIKGENVISFQLPTEADWVTSQDDLANTAMFSFNDSVAEFTKLPNVDRQGRLVKIAQAEDERADDYWVWYKKGIWAETFGWNCYEKPDPASMPHVLVDNGNGTWTLKPHDWPGRLVGDTDSNPSPTFVGRTINRMFLYRGRMVILSDENFIASEIGNYENFYRTTCTQLLDDDPIDVASPNSRGAALHTGEEFDGKLLLSSKFDQFVVDGSNDDILSPNTVTIKKVNAYNMSPDVVPASVGPNFVFVDDFETRGYALLREYQVERVFGRQVALSVTDQVPEYIPSGVYSLSASASDDVLVALTRGDRTHAWLYNYYFNSDGKVLSSWQKWEFPFAIHGGGFLDDRLLLTVGFGANTYIVSISFESGVDAVLDSNSILLDMAVTSGNLPVTFANNQTTFVLPYAIPSGSVQDIRAVVVPGTTGEGQSRAAVSTVGNSVTFAGDLRNTQLVIGLRFRFYWKLSPIYMRDQNQVAIQDGRLQLRYISIFFNHSGPFDIRVTPEGRETFTARYANFVLGDSTSTIGGFHLNSDKFRAAAFGEGEKTDIEVEAYTPWRVRFSSLEWDGAYRARKKRTT
ncbi:phage nozzle protein [Rhizobium sp. Leaf341]|uniref:phage nozzle protein n=1 Tax=Rhizobium sp. Leaf341 TaxID=1736344 RepID=UPI0007124DEA|nr:hypothetical protein [Rhizobium sp. Leaf341]KQR67868.1 hypothetical protein ASG03_10130 [Rhizobium sp. Leaf341]